MKGENRYRLILIPKNEAQAPTSSEIALDEFKTILSDLSSNQITVLESNWLKEEIKQYEA